MKPTLAYTTSLAGARDTAATFTAPDADDNGASRAPGVVWRAHLRLLSRIARHLIGALGVMLACTAAAQNYTFLGKFGSFGSGNGQFNVPRGVAIDPVSRNIVVVDEVNNRVQIFDSAGNFLSKFGSSGGGNGQLNQPGGVAIDPVTRNIVVVDSLNQRIQIFTSAGAYVGQFGWRGGELLITGPWDVDIDPFSRNIVVSSLDRVKIFDSAGVFLTNIGTPGSGNGQFVFAFPLTVAIDPVSRNIVVADSGNHRVQIFNSTGAYLGQFGSQGSGNGQFIMPWTVAIDPTSRDIVVGDYGGNRIQIFTSAGAYLGQFGKHGTLNGEFMQPASAAIDPLTHSIVVADAGNNRVQIFRNTSPPGPAPPPSAVNYQGLWWNAPAGSESGWGINFAHQGDVIFATWFTYDAAGRAWWLTMTADKTAPNAFAGALFQTRGPAFNAVPFNPAAVTATPVGSGTLTFGDANNGTFAYTVNGISQTKAITRQVFGPLPVCVFGAQSNLAPATNFQDLWWAAPAGSESGWGINFTHQGDIIFASWFTYDTDGAPLWLVVTANRSAPGVYTGTLYRTTGPAFNATPFNPAGVVATAAGTATLTFANGNAGTFAYTVNGISQTKSITRQVFRAPGTVCQ